MAPRGQDSGSPGMRKTDPLAKGAPADSRHRGTEKDAATGLEGQPMPMDQMEETCLGTSIPPISPALLWGLRVLLQTEWRGHCSMSSKPSLQSPFSVAVSPKGRTLITVRANLPARCCRWMKD